MKLAVPMYQQLDALRTVRQEVRRELLAEAKKHQAWKRLCQIPSIGPIRAAVLLGILQTPHRFRTKRQLWSYSGFGIETHSSADHRRVDGGCEARKIPAEGDVFFLDFSLYRTYQASGIGSSNRGVSPSSAAINVLLDRLEAFSGSDAP